MRLYRIRQRWSNGAIAVQPDGVYELTADEAAQIGADCPNGLVELTEAEVATIRDGLAAAGVMSTSFRPPAADRSTVGRSGGDGAMNSGNMVGFVAR
jgi:hypothetical protein